MHRDDSKFKWPQRAAGRKPRRPRRTHSSIAVILSLILALPPEAVAQSFAVGYAKYQRGDFKGAEQSLSQALSANPSPSETAKILKILGISQYMLGNRSAAAASFTKGLSISPSLKVNAAEVLDESVILFFEKQRSAVNSGSKPEVTAGRGAAPRTSKKSPPTQPVAPKPSPPQRSAASRDGNGATQTKKTVLKVQSNVAGAQISIDGILAGRSGELINTDPGVVPIEVKSPGYITKSVHVTITKDRENTVTINLEKIPPPPPPKPKPRAKQTTIAGATSPGQSLGKNKSTGPSRTAPSRSMGKGAGNNPQASDGDDLFAPTPKDEMFFDGKNPPSPGPAGGGQDLASEFERDAAAAAAPPPMAPGYPAAAPMYPPAGAAPGYGTVAPPPPQAYMPPPPVYPYGAPPAYYGGFSPAPMYVAPPVYQPPPVYTPPPDPVQSPGQPNPQSPGPGYNDPAPLPDPAYSDVENSSTSSAPDFKRTSIRLTYIMPFGIGQFSQRRVPMGLFFAGVEVGLLYGAYYNQTVATDAQRKGNQEKEECSRVECNEQTLAENIASYQEEIKQGNMLMSACLIGAGVAIFAGAIEALMHAHDPIESGKSRKKRGKGQPSK